MDASDAAAEARHADNQRRFIALEDKTDATNAKVDRIDTNTAALLEMWQDAGIVFRWMRRTGNGLIWIGKVVIAVGVVFGIYIYTSEK
jgi:cytochrome c biogenesis factor